MQQDAVCDPGVLEGHTPHAHPCTQAYARAVGKLPPTPPRPPCRLQVENSRLQELVLLLKARLDDKQAGGRP